MKTCPRCQQRLPEEAFYAAPARYDGLSSYCRRCWSAYWRIWRAAHLEQTRAVDRACKRRARALDRVLRERQARYGGGQADGL